MTEENFILKLFDTLKEAIRDMNDTLKQLLNNQKSIGEYMKTLPITELKESLKDHNKESNDNIDTCTETVNTQTKDILKGIRSIKDILVRVIITVSVFFGLITSGWFYKTFIHPSTPTNNGIIELKKTLEEEKVKNEKILKEQTKVIEDLRKTIKDLHQ